VVTIKKAIAEVNSYVSVVTIKVPNNWIN